MIRYKKINKINEYDSNGYIFIRNFYYYRESKNRFSMLENRLVEMDSLFQLTYSLGKLLLNKALQICDTYDDFVDVFDSLFLNNKSFVYNNCRQWIIENGYPYPLNHESTECNDSDLIQFAIDCMKLALLFNIHLWINKLIDYQAKDEEILTNELEMLLKILNAKQLILNSTTFWGYEYNKSFNLNDQLQLLEDIKCSLKQKRNEFINSLRNILIIYLLDTIDNRPEMLITKQIPVYIPSQNFYCIYCGANSIIGIAYYKLLLNLSTFNYEGKYKICDTPQCINYFVKTGNTRYCKECKNAGIGDKQKNRKYNHSLKGKQQRNLYYTKVVKPKREEARRKNVTNMK